MPKSDKTGSGIIMRHYLHNRLQITFRAIVVVTLLSMAPVMGSLANDDFPRLSADISSRAPTSMKEARSTNIPMHYVIVFEDGVTESQRKRVLELADGKIDAEMTKIFDGLILILSPTDAEAFTGLSGVRSVTPSLKVEPFAFTPPEIPWGIDRLDQHFFPLDGSYEQPVISDGAGVKIYVVDTGVAPHADFVDRLVSGYDTRDPLENGILPEEQYNNAHGTYVAGVAAGASLGVSPSSTLVPIFAVTSVADIVLGLEWVASVHTPGERAVVNMSFGCYVSTNCIGYGEAEPAIGEHPIEIATQAIIDLGMIAVIAAGNSATDACEAIPARVAAGLTVAATGDNDRPWPYSNYGSCVDLYAPGEDILTATGADSTAAVSGTSFAAPHVAGVIARLWSTLPSYDSTKIINEMLNLALKGRIVDLSDSTPDVLASLATPPSGIGPPEIVIEPVTGYLRESGQAAVRWRRIPDLTEDQISRFRFEINNLDYPACVAYTEDTECIFERGLPTGSYKIDVIEDNPAGSTRLSQIEIYIPTTHTFFERALDLTDLAYDEEVSDGFLRFYDDLFYATDELNTPSVCGKYHWYQLNLEAPSRLSIRGHGLQNFNTLPPQRFNICLSQGPDLESQEEIACFNNIDFWSDTANQNLNTGMHFIRSQATSCEPRFMASLAIDWKLRTLLPPFAPVIQGFSLSQSGAVVQFEPVTPGELTPVNEYKLTCRDTNDDSLFISYATGSPITIEKLTPGNSYECQIAAVNMAGDSVASMTLGFTAGAVPGVPLLSVEPDIESVRAFVQPAGIEMVDEYAVSCGSTYVETTAPLATVSPLDEEIPVSCMARVKNINGWSAWSTPMSVIPEGMPRSNILLLIQAIESAT